MTEKDLQGKGSHFFCVKGHDIGIVRPSLALVREKDHKLYSLLGFTDDGLSCFKVVKLWLADDTL